MCPLHCIFLYLMCKALSHLVCVRYPSPDHQHFPKGQFCLLAFLSLDRSFVSSMSPTLNPPNLFHQMLLIIIISPHSLSTIWNIWPAYFWNTHLLCGWLVGWLFGWLVSWLVGWSCSLRNVITSQFSGGVKITHGWLGENLIGEMGFEGTQTSKSFKGCF